jgi:RiboL-PSP-HEPN
MGTIFEAIKEDFVGDLDAIRNLITTFSDPTQSPKIRIAASNSVTLLVAATFEEFVREMAREYARAVVKSTESFEMLPTNLASTAWKRTMDGLGKIKIDNSQRSGTDVIGAAHARFVTIYEFCRGDLSKDIYRELIHNENNMRPMQINSLFKVSGLKDVCTKCSDKQPLLDVFGETEPEKAHGKLLSYMEDFFERRNCIAHALNPGQSSSPEQIATDIDMLESFGKALFQTLDAMAPPLHLTQAAPVAGQGEDAPAANEDFNQTIAVCV